MKLLVTLLSIFSLTASAAPNRKVDAGTLEFKQQTTPNNPASGYNRVYVKSDGKVYNLSSAGVEAELGAGSSGEGAKNYVINPGAETDATTGITATNTTVTRNTTSPLYETADFSFTIDSATDVVEWSLNAFDVELKNQICEVGGVFTADANGENVQVQLYRNSVAVGSKNLWTTGTSQPQEFGIYAPCGDLTNATTLRVVGTAATSTAVKIDHLQVTKIKGLSRSQVGGTWVGRVYQSAASGCVYTNSATSFTDFAAVASCNGWASDSGSISAISTKKIGFTYNVENTSNFLKITVTPLGKYGSAGSTRYRFSDGTDSSTEASAFSSGTSEEGYGSYIFWLNPTSTGSKTYFLQNRAQSGAAGLGIIYNDTAPLEITVEEYPRSTAVLTAAAKTGDYDWTDYSATITSLAAAPQSVTLKQKMENGILSVKGEVTTGTTQGALATITLPNNYKIDSSRNGPSNTTAAAGVPVGDYRTNGANIIGALVTATGTSDSLIYFGNTTNVGNALFPVNGSTILGSGALVKINFSVPILGWTKSAVSASITGEPGVYAGVYKEDCSWSRSSTTTGDFTADTSCVLQERTNNNFGTVTAAGGSNTLPGWVLTPKQTGRYLACVNLTGNASSASQEGVFTLLSDSTTLLQAGSNTTAYTTVSGCAPFSTVAGVSQTLKVQGAASAGAINLSPIGGSGYRSDVAAITIFPITQNLPGLFGDGVGGKTYSVAFGGATEGSVGCSTNPCTVYRQSSPGGGNWVSGVTRSNQGDYLVNVVSGTFTGKPTCTVSSDSNIGVAIAMIDYSSNTSATQIRVNTFNTGQVAINQSAYLVCTP